MMPPPFFLSMVSERSPASDSRFLTKKSCRKPVEIQLEKREIICQSVAAKRQVKIPAFPRSILEIRDGGPGCFVGSEKRHYFLYWTVLCVVMSTSLVKEQSAIRTLFIFAFFRRLESTDWF